jgi:murein DD-endopeptidase MepM/ murein hydrolase activator NlpD
LRRLGVIALAVTLVLGLAMARGFGSGEPTYVVQPGDTLWSIAEEDGLTVAALAAANDMAPGAILEAGRVIVIPPQGGSGDVATSEAIGAGAVSGTAGAAPGGAGCPDEGVGPYGALPSLLVAEGDEALIPVFEHWAAVYGVSPAVVEAITWQESGWQQGIVSLDGAVGIGQLLPDTAQFVSQDLIGAPLDIWSVNDNIRMSTRFVAYLAAQEGGNLCATIAAYYEGPGNEAQYGVLAQSVQYVADVEGLLPRFE